ncbi:hypothetical protein Sme01_62720 [Sphaerisporangium melleum]|uniref:Uncharacterized protein n=1 Tax=Sphaerisporangium melleum TaxID=321316 RepID=A0A917R0S4_9ACTN|nr:hypothetical protein [Sphaerisporangium melleum]GGK81856.1 hypothetical protein GCM10007964_25620 [Sphaerisporangium melleum]GII73796.1 hypothetical protein Sme01_62720 [Sphaerisporangium melleum]
MNPPAFQTFTTDVERPAWLPAPADLCGFDVQADDCGEQDPWQAEVAAWIADAKTSVLQLPEETAARW